MYICVLRGKTIKLIYRLFFNEGYKVETDKIIANLRKENEQLRKENTYLKEQLSLLVKQQHSPKNNSSENPPIITKHSPLHEKINLYRSLFRGRTDIYALRWESKKGTSGISQPAPTNGSSQYAKNLRSDAQIVNIENCCHLPTKFSLIICKVIMLLDCIQCIKMKLVPF